MKRLILLLSVVSLVCTGKSMATPILNAVFNTGNATWDHALGPYNTVDPLTVDHSVVDGTAVQLIFSNIGGPNPQGDLTASGGYYGYDGISTYSDYTTITPSLSQLTVSFKLTSLNGAPAQQSDALAFFFQAENGDRWYHDITPPSIAAATLREVNIGTAAGWYTPGGNLLDYMADLRTVSFIGFELMGNANIPGQIYEFSELQFQVPEPETIWMILMVLGSLAVVFRSRMGEMLAQLRARVRI